MGRWWWLKPGFSKSRCKARRKDPYMLGQCKNKSHREGLCKVHLRLAGKLKKCPKCKREH